MAEQKKTTTRRTTAAKKTAPKVEKIETVVEAPVVKKTYSDNDKIPCTSITPGKYVFTGDKSKTAYNWGDAGITEDMRYDDLTAAIRTHKPCIFKPRIIINDDEFLAEYPEIQKLYDSLYSKDDLTQILTLPADRMIDIIKQLPDGAKEAIRSMAVTAIDDGTLDSVARVRALDQYFGTDMLLKLAN